jgi:ribosome-associated protein
MTEVSEKKDVQKLQRTIVDSLEDVKAQDIQVFNTEHLSPLFERVVIACGTSNRQTKALAANVRDDVRDAGFGKPRIEGEENGEWIIVDCGPVVVHIMQPTIRQYYHLEEIWGDKPVRLKLGAAKPLPTPKPVAVPKEVPKKAARKTTSKTAPKTAAKTTAAKQPAAKKTAAKSPSTKKPVSKKTVAKKSPPRPSKP